MSGDLNRADLLRLLSAHSDGCLSDTERERLVALLRASPEARRTVIDHAFLESMLMRESQGESFARGVLSQSGKANESPDESLPPCNEAEMDRQSEEPVCPADSPVHAPAAPGVRRNLHSVVRRCTPAFWVSLVSLLVVALDLGDRRTPHPFCQARCSSREAGIASASGGAVPDYSCFRPGV